MLRTFKILLEKDPSGGYAVSVPALRGCVTEGESVEECLKNAKEAIELYIESLKEDHQPIPQSDVLLEEVEVKV